MGTHVRIKHHDSNGLARRRQESRSLGSRPGPRARAKGPL